MKFEHRLKEAIRKENLELIHEVFEEIYNEYNGLIYFIILKYVKNCEDIKDLVQEAFISFYSNIDKDFTNIKYYLVQTARNKVRNYLKTKSKYSLDDDILNKMEDNCHINTKYDDIIDRMKDSLSDYEIDILLEHIENNLTFKEIALKHNQRLNTIISVYNRAKKKITKGGKNEEDSL